MRRKIIVDIETTENGEVCLSTCPALYVDSDSGRSVCGCFNEVLDESILKRLIPCHENEVSDTSHTSETEDEGECPSCGRWVPSVMRTKEGCSNCDRSYWRKKGKEQHGIFH